MQKSCHLAAKRPRKDDDLGIEKAVVIDYWMAVRTANVLRSQKVWQAVVLITRMSALSIGA
jgi:hypothetical protein